MSSHQTIETVTHGRYLVEPAARGAPLLVGFHGYAESAAIQLERLQAIAGSNRWTIVSIQGLHRFYQRRSNEVVASWMTREDRELAIADNRAYVAATLDREQRAHGAGGAMFAGFSQGVAMAFRSAASSTHQVLGIVAVGGDVPPEIDTAGLARLGHVLLLRGARDPFYSVEKFQQDQERLRDANVQLTAVEFDGGHEWSAPVLDAAAYFLSSRFV